MLIGGLRQLNFSFLQLPLLLLCLARLNLCSLAFQAALSPSRFVRARHEMAAFEPEIHDSEAVEAFYLERFKRRKQEINQVLAQARQARPPNASLSAEETITRLLHGLARPHHPQRYFGIDTLLRASTTSWRAFLSRSVAAPEHADNLSLAAALESAMSRPHNQFRILIGLEDEGYVIDFPTECLDYGDGTCWVECRLRDKDTKELLVVLGWSLLCCEETSAWIVDGLDWQDFRDMYRPGIGREEWERICG